MAQNVMSVILALSLIIIYAAAGGSWGAAVPATAGLTAATQAVCPAGAPVSCSSISEPDYCCALGNYCAWASGNVVGCCPSGETCTGAIGGGGVATTWVQTSTWVQSTWAPSTTTTYWQPSTLYVTTAVPTTTVYGGIYVTEGVATTVATQQQATTEYLQQTTQGVYDQGYCSTLYAHGAGLPTTREGTCGTILVESKAVRPGYGVMALAGPIVILVPLLWL